MTKIDAEDNLNYRDKKEKIQKKNNVKVASAVPIDEAGNFSEWLEAHYPNTIYTDLPSDEKSFIREKWEANID
tara:strand:+ start:258 stop:476 length:219 start_codon:yes stop_codon:yes gene_type:complete